MVDAVNVLVRSAATGAGHGMGMWAIGKVFSSVLASEPPKLAMADTFSTLGNGMAKAAGAMFVARFR
jgi:hypothetical protein